ncbi:hypothetical protein L4C36_18900 [Photobacterium japonica]|uniref:hypothetical protein n=1 Tax=Photobacterium japonica TaxID=2910235 RepID=UPI003D096795
MMELTKLQTLNLESVKEVYRKKASGMVAHAGLLLEFTCGRQAILHNTPERGAHLSSFEQFAENQKVNVTKEYVSELDTMKQRIINVLSNPKDYCIFDNCEHLASKVITGVPSSPQLVATTSGAVIGGTIGYALAKENKVIGTVVGGLIFGLLSLQIAKSCKLQ